MSLGTNLDVTIGMSGRAGAGTMSLDFLTTTSLDPRITFSRGTNATLTDSTGRITYAPANLLTWSQDFSNAAWTKVNVSATATTLTDDATAGGHYARQTLATVFDTGQTAIMSATLQAGTSSFVAFGLTDGGNRWISAVANLATGQITQTATSANTVITATNIENLGGGRFRVSICGATTVSGTFYNAQICMVPAATGNTFVTGGFVSYSGTGTSVSVLGVQVERATYQTTPSTYVATTSAAYYGPRFDYDPVTLAARGLLIEEQRTNLVTYSEDWTNAAWQKNNCAVTANATTSPDGTVTADTVTANAGTAFHYVRRTSALTPTGAHTYTFYVKKNTASWVFFTVSDNGINYFNLDTGLFGTTPDTCSASVAGNGWYRISVTRTLSGIPANAADCGIGVANGDGGASFNAAGTESVYIWGAQLEAGAFATSYIPTVASQVTRTADVAAINAPNFASWYNQASGSFVVEATGYVVDTNTRSILSAYASGATSNNILFINAVQRQFQINNSGNQADIDGGTPASGVVTKAAGAYAANDFALSLGGAAVVTDTSGTIPTVDTLAIGASSLGTTQLNGWVRSIRYYPTRLSNAQLQALSA